MPVDIIAAKHALYVLTAAQLFKIRLREEQSTTKHAGPALRLFGALAALVQDIVLRDKSWPVGRPLALLRPF